MVPLRLPRFSAGQLAAAAALVQQFPGLVLRGDAKLGVPSFMMNRDGFLSDPSGLEPGRLARQFISQHQTLLGLTNRDLAELG